MVNGYDEERDEDLGDRILVRPYVLPDDPDDPHEAVEQAAAIVTRPLTIDADVPTAVYPATGRAPAPPADVSDRRMLLWLVGAGLAVVVAAAIVMIALWPQNDSGPQQAGSGPPVMPVGAGPRPARDLASATASASPSASLSASASPSPSRPSDAASAKHGAAAPTVDTLMAGGRTGPVANGDGQCLDAGTPGVATGAMLARPCNGSAAQRFTVASDKTLRIGGLCAAAGSGTVRSAACTGGGGQQWQSGPNGSVVNVGTGQCLTNPRNGAKGGNRVRLSSCQDDGQNWSLP